MWLVKGTADSLPAGGTVKRACTDGRVVGKTLYPLAALGKRIRAKAVLERH
jgi:hypothetical protein